jgi:hypothetical protein
VASVEKFNTFIGTEFPLGRAAVSRAAFQAWTKLGEGWRGAQDHFSVKMVSRSASAKLKKLADAAEDEEDEEETEE